MAKGSFLGVKRGKLGDAVGYNVTNSNDKDKQGWRVYQPVVRNPQSDGQMVQRCKMAAVNNLYRALKDVIRRGFENHKYGDDSRRAWLKVALGQDFSTGPWMVKGSMQPVPIKTVPITVGSLQPVSVTYDEGEQGFITNILSDETPADIAILSSKFIAAGYQEGDQVTIIQGWVPLRLAFAWRVVSFYIDTTDTTSLSDLGILADNTTVGSQDFLLLQLDHSADALAIAVSRDGENVNLRSTAYVATNPTTVDAVYYGNAMYEMAKRSYMNTLAANTNWPLDPGSGGYTPVVQSAFTRAGTEFTPVSIARKNVGGQNFEVIVDDGGVQYYIGSRPSAASSEIVYLSGTGSTASVDPSDLSTANSVNVFDSANTAAGLRAWLISKGVDATVLPV